MNDDPLRSQPGARALALAALTVACVVLGPTPRVIEALERVYAVQIDGSEVRRRDRDRVGGGGRPRPGPRGRRPLPVRP